MSNLPAPERCAICGADIPPRAQACPECGADERTGWREQSLYDGLDLPETAESNSDTRRTTSGPSAQTRFRVVIALVLLLVVVLLVLLNRF